MVTEEHVDIFAAERRMVFASKVDELALLLAGESGEKAGLVLDVMGKELDGALGDEVLDLLLQAILLRKIQIERAAMMTERFQ